MKRLNLKNFRLILDEDNDYFHPDIINMNVIEDGTNPSVDQLNEQQSKIALCLALKKLVEYQKQNNKILHLIRGY